MATILVADSDEWNRGLLRLTLRREGFGVIIAADEGEALEALNTGHVDLVLMDVMAPHWNGWELAGRLNKESRIPFIIVSARGEQSDILRGFQLGADDYMLKPYHTEELVMRVRAVLKRCRVAASKIIQIGNVTVDRAMHEVRIGEHRLQLPLKEFMLLYTFASYPNQTLSRNQLIEQVWGVNYSGDERTVDVHMKRLRMKIGKLSDQVAFTTVRGLGYRLEVPASK